MTFEQWRQDLYVACRELLRVKAFTGTAVATLAVGIAGVTVMFALIEGVLLRPLPVREQDRLLVAWKELRSSGFAHYPFRVAEIDSISKEGRLFESAAGVDYNGAQRGSSSTRARRRMCKAPPSRGISSEWSVSSLFWDAR